MTKVSRKGFVDKKGQKVVIVPNIPGATAGNLASFDAEGNLQDSGKAIDQSPTDNSTNLVTSGGVKAALDDKCSLVGQTISLVVNGQEIEIESSDVPNLIRALSNPDSTPTASSDKLITSKAVYDALQEAEGLTVDSALSPSSTNPVQNKAVYDALQEAEGLTVDSALSPSSTNPVQNKVVSDALAGKMDALEEIELRFDSQVGYYTMHANADDIIPFISAEDPQLVVVKCSIDTNADQIVNVRAIGSLNIYHTEHYDWNIELRVGETLFGRSFTARNTQEAEEAIDSMFDDYGAGAQVSKMNVTLFPSVS